LLLLSVLFAPTLAAAQGESSSDGPEDELAVRLPVRLTAGHADHLMGVAAPRANALFFIGNEHGTTEILVQAPISSGPRPLFDALGDHAFPRVSPDGQKLAYISYVRDATGDACVRSVDGDDERCLTGPGTAELEVLWLDKGSRLGVLSRAGLHAGFTLSSYPIDGGASRSLLERDMIGLSRSPDGRHLAYVAIEPRRSDVGVSFASRVGRGLRVERLGAKGAQGPAIAFEPELPGLSGFPAFSLDGHHLYFSQYLNDTNRDGVIDGADHSVLVRVGFDGSRADPFAGQPLEQLTSARWNCHYPAPTATALLMTCSHGGSLDIYSLPLDGVVPARWPTARLQAELGVVRDLWAKLLLASRLAQRFGPGDARLAIWQEVIWLHLALREYESALYFTKRVASLAGPGSARERWAGLFAELAEHRRADLALARGQLSRAYIEAERERLARLEALGALPGPPDSPDLRQADLAALTHLVRGEILDDLGDKAAALAALRAVDVDPLSDRFTLQLCGDRSRRIHGYLGDREAALAMRARLSAHPAFGLPERLEHASDHIEELLRGRDTSERRAALAAAREHAPDGSELALLLDVERALVELTDADQEKVRARIFELYTAEQEPERRRAIALRTVRAASRRGNEFLQYQFATTWASSVRPEDPQRRYAEELYRAIVVERAYGELGQGEIREAGAYFFQASRNAQALDAHIGFIEARLRQGLDLAETRAWYDKRFASKSADPGYLFASAYLAARELPSIHDPERHAEVAGEVVQLLTKVDAAWPRRIEVHHLWGYALHRAALVTRSRQDAGSANSHYLLALDLARGRPRARAALLQALGTLQAGLGKHRRALEHFELRARLPFASQEAELAYELARSRSFFHAGDLIESREAAQSALARIDADASLARFRAPAVDRLAFAALAAGEAGEASQRYAELLRILAGKDDTPINRLKALIGQASANLRAGNPQLALDAALRAQSLLATHPELAARGPSSLVERYVYDRDHYLALLAGLRSEALLRLARLPEAAEALAERERALTGFFEATEADEDLLAIAQARLRQAEVERARGDASEAQRRAEAGLQAIAEFNARTGSGVTDTGLGLLSTYAELHLFGGIPREALNRDLPGELSAAYDFMTRYPNPRWRRARMRFEIYLTLLRSPLPSATDRSPG
jgi:cellulose synthase operon protein C